MRIILLCIVSAVVYGILLDQVTARVCVEYFTVGHTPVFPTESPTLLAFEFGILATWWMGLILGILAALACGVGPWPKLDAARLIQPVACLLVVMAVAALLAGITGYQLAEASGFVLPEPFGPRVPKDHHRFFFVDSLAHLAAYSVGAIGGAILCVRAILQRRRMARNKEADRPDPRLVVLSRWVARTVSIPLFGLIVVLAFGDGVPNPLRASLQQNLLSMVVPVMLVTLSIAWRWEGVGGLLTLGGLALFAAATQRILLDIVLIPWLVTGLLYLACSIGKRRARRRRRVRACLAPSGDELTPVKKSTSHVGATTMRPRRRISVKILISLATLMVVGGIVVVKHRVFQLQYYKWQMERAQRQAYDGQKTTENGFVVAHVPREAEERYEYYRQKLVELGSITERHYVFQHLWVPSDDSKHFSKLLVSGRCPNHVDFLSPYPDKPELTHLTVWCWATDASAWDHFVAEHDVADYRERFLARGKEKGEKGVGKNPEWFSDDGKNSRK
ncbi:MAG: hypothetical protein ABFC77_08190 [Thermoguttaceae bacterium]